MARFSAVLALLGLAGVAGAQAPAVTTLKVKTRIVAIDVVVTDKQGKPVKGLQASDFALAENGAPQKIAHFEAHASLSAEDAATLPPMPKLAPNIFTNYSPAPANSALNVLLLDELNTRMKDKAVVLKQVLQYLATPHPGARMAIFELTSDLRLLQGFTSDPEVLRKALTSPRAVAHTSRLVDDPPCGSSPTEETDWSTPVRLDNPNYAAIMAGRECRDNAMQDRSLSTLQAMSELARYMGGLPGRKNLLWFSASFSARPNRSTVSDELDKTTALFAKSQVAVYPIVASGLIALPPATLEVARGFLDKVDAAEITMERIAEDTGGKVFANSNDLAGAAEQAVNDGSNYYTLTYSPTNRDWKGEFRKVEVKLAQSGYTLAYRRGYYADDLDKPARKVEAKADAPAAAPDPAKMAMWAAMEYGSPQPTEIVFKAAVNPATGRPENVVAKANSVAPKVSGPFERYVLSIAALPTAFTFTRSAPGKIHMGAKLVTCVYTADGALINSTTLTINGDIDDARYQSIMENGVKFQQEVSVPVKGENFLRIGVEDLATNRMGVVEIPVEMVAKLKPVGGVEAVQR